MKIRTGFVSNSSSSSFLIYGTRVDADPKTEEALEAETGWKGEFRDLYVHANDVDVAIGTSWSRVQDDETGAAFKQRVEQRVNAVLDRIGHKDKRVFRTLEEAWSDH